MAILGFDALGQLALGQIPTVTFAVTTGPLVFSTFSQPFPVAPSLKVYLHPPVNFEVERPADFNPPTPGPLVFTRFSEPIFIKRVNVNLNTGVEFRVLRPDAATPNSLVFASFPSQVLTKKADVNSQTEVRFRVLVPDAATPTALVFTKFSEPKFDKVRQQSNTNSSFFQDSNILGGDFADFDLLSSKKIPQQGFTGFVFVPQQIPSVFSSFGQPLKITVIQTDVANAPFVTPVVTQNYFGFADWQIPPKTKFLGDFSNTPQFLAVQNYTFTSFSQPSIRGIVKEGQITFNGSLGPAVTPSWFVFSEYSQPRFKGYPAHEQDSVFFRVLRPDVATPSDMGVFTQYSQPYFSKYPSSQQPSTFFELLSFAGTQTPADMGVFLPFSQPYFYKYPSYQQPDTFFEILPPPVVITTPVFTGFNDFGVPVYKRVTIDNQSFIFSPFFQPYVFSSFAQPLANKLQLLSFSNSPQPQFIQTFVFSAFDQPVITRLLREGGVSFEILTPSQATATPTSLVFARFLEPVRTSTVNWLIDGVATIHYEPIFIPPVVTDEQHFLPFLTTMGKLKSF